MFLKFSTPTMIFKILQICNGIAMTLILFLAASVLLGNFIHKNAEFRNVNDRWLQFVFISLFYISSIKSYLLVIVLIVFNCNYSVIKLTLQLHDSCVEDTLTWIFFTFLCVFFNRGLANWGKNCRRYVSTFLKAYSQFGLNIIIRDESGFVSCLNWRDE